MRIISPEPTVAITQRFVLTGNFELRAAFLPGAANTAEFGFAFGRGDGVKTHLAVVLRPDGSVTIESHAPTRDPLRRWDAAHSWKGSTDPVLLEMRVANSRARLFVNGKVVGELALSARQVEGAAGIFVGAGADLRVSGFSVTATRESLR